MADGLNKAILIGNLGAEPELRHTANGNVRLVLRLATNESWRDKAGERQERTEWHNVVVWGKRAEALHPMLTKGRHLAVDGRIHTRSYDKEGQKRYITEVIADNIVLLGRRPDSTSTSMGGGSGHEGLAALGAVGDDIPF